MAYQFDAIEVAEFTRACDQLLLADDCRIDRDTVEMLPVETLVTCDGGRSDRSASKLSPSANLHCATEGSG